MARGMVRCGSCILLAVLAVLLTDVCGKEQGKICDFWENVVLQFRAPCFGKQVTLSCAPCYISLCLRVFRIG